MIERGILYVVDPAANCIRQQVLTMLKYLNRARYKPYLVVSEDDYLIEHARKLNVDYIASPGISTASKINIGGICRHIEEFIAERKINLIHSHGTQACYVAANLAKSLNIPHISTVHLIDDSHKKKGLFSVGADKILAMADHLIAVSEVVKASIDGVSNKISLIYNGIEADRFAETLDSEQLFRELGIEKGSSLIGAITTLEPRKGTDIFLDAAALLAGLREDIRFVVVGDGPELEALKKKAIGLGIGKRTYFLGFRRDVAHILKSLDVVVIPNLSPGLPIILLEALASSKPVIITDVPGVREAVSDNEVEFVPVKDPVAIDKAVRKVLSQRVFAGMKAQEGQKLVKDKFSVQQMMKPTESLYLKLAK